MYCYLDRGCEEDKIKSQHYRRIEPIQGSFIFFSITQDVRKVMRTVYHRRVERIVKSLVISLFIK